MYEGEVLISNMALQMLGASPISSLNENSVSAIECNTCYHELRKVLLESSTWVAATKLAELAVDVAVPAFGRAYQYTLPADYLRKLPREPGGQLEPLDWVLQGRTIHTNQGAPLYLRYVYDLIDTTVMSASFRLAFSALMAEQMCERITGSNQHALVVQRKYDAAMEMARFNDDIEKPPRDIYDTSTWVTCRY